jgi:hypothetical protein
MEGSPFFNAKVICPFFKVSVKLGVTQTFQTITIYNLNVNVMSDAICHIYPSGAAQRL